MHLIYKNEIENALFSKLGTWGLGARCDCCLILSNVPPVRCCLRLFGLLQRPQEHCSSKTVEQQRAGPALAGVASACLQRRRAPVRLCRRAGAVKGVVPRQLAPECPGCSQIAQLVALHGVWTFQSCLNPYGPEQLMHCAVRCVLCMINIFLPVAR